MSEPWRNLELETLFQTMSLLKLKSSDSYLRGPEPPIFIPQASIFARFAHCLSDQYFRGTIWAGKVGWNVISYDMELLILHQGLGHLSTEDPHWAQSLK